MSIKIKKDMARCTVVNQKDISKFHDGISGYGKALFYDITIDLNKQEGVGCHYLGLKKIKWRTQSRQEEINDWDFQINKNR